MTLKTLHRLLAAALLALGPTAAVAADPWQVTAEAATEIKAFKSTSRGIEDTLIYDMANNDMGNRMVYGGTVDDRTPLLGIYDLLACFHITHPESSMDVKFGGGIRIALDGVQFTKGKWDAVVHMTEQEIFEVDAREKYLLLDLVRVGVNDLQKVRHKIGVVKLMAKACLPIEVSAPKVKYPKAK